MWWCSFVILSMSSCWAHRRVVREILTQSYAERENLLRPAIDTGFSCFLLVSYWEWAQTIAGRKRFRQTRGIFNISPAYWQYRVNTVLLCVFMKISTACKTIDLWRNVGLLHFSENIRDIDCQMPAFCHVVMICRFSCVESGDLNVSLLDYVLLSDWSPYIHVMLIAYPLSQAQNVLQFRSIEITFWVWSLVEAHKGISLPPMSVKGAIGIKLLTLPSPKSLYFFNVVAQELLLLLLLLLSVGCQNCISADQFVH